MKLRSALAIVGLPDRKELKAALAAREQAVLAVDVKRETLKRLQSVVDQADNASRTAADATRAATEARTAWVRGGCTYSAARELQVLEDLAQEAARAAERAEVNANVVRRELARAQDAVQSAQIDVHDCERKIANEIGLIVLAKLRPDLELVERKAHDFCATRARIMAVKPMFDRYLPHAPLASGEALATIEAALTRATIRSWDEERNSAHARDRVEGELGRDEAQLEEFMAPLRAWAEALRTNPDAELS